MRTPIITLVVACAGVIGAADVAAQGKPTGTYPAKSIRIVVPYPPGGTSDILSRLIGAKVTENWAQQVVVDNRTGANGNIGAEHTARSAPDGYTLMVTDIGNLSIAIVDARGARCRKGARADAQRLAYRSAARRSRTHGDHLARQ